jgi:hypothetical protein
MPLPRNVIRWVVLLLGLTLVAWDVPEALYNFRNWRANWTCDPVAEKFWRAALRMDLSEMAMVLGVAILVWFILKPRRKKLRSGESI